MFKTFLIFVYFTVVMGMTFIYFLSIHLFYLAIAVVSPFNRKAGMWIKGRQGWRKRLKDWNQEQHPVVWFHAASLGEFEQGRPLMEEIHKLKHYKILLTFFSPSGFEVRKNYPGADLILYLPLDSPYNARLFVRMVKPSVTLFIKYEFWFYYLQELHRNHFPVYLISTLFRPGQVYFRNYGAWFRKKLGFVDFFYLQDEGSAVLLRKAGISNTMVCGDTRFDRVNAIVTAALPVDAAARFSAGKFCIVAGSTWPKDEELLLRYISKDNGGTKWIIAPHEINEKGLLRLESRLARPSVRFSKAEHETLQQNDILIIDSVGMLSSLYRYGQMAYIGGGFGKGIHNILEAAAYGIPVIFGPNYRRFREAIELIQAGGAFTFNDYKGLSEIIHTLRHEQGTYSESATKATAYVKRNTGATLMIYDHLLRTSVLHKRFPFNE